MDAEHGLQHWFSKLAPLAIMLPPLAVLLFAWFLEETPDRAIVERRAIAVAYESVAIDAAPPLRIAGAWALSSADPGFGGISALAVEDDLLLALGDSGRLIRLPKPGGQADAIIRDLPDGPGNPRLKRSRDSEALLRDPRGWWVAFEWRHELWLYDQAFRRALARVAIPADGWHPNAGIEAMAADGGDLLLFHETRGVVIRLRGKQAVTLPVRGLRAAVSDAATLPDGRTLLLERGLTLAGFANAVVLLEHSGSGYRVASRFPLPLGPLDNAEALAVEPLATGGVRLWLMTDDNFQRPLRTLLVALDLPPEYGRR